MTRVSDKHDRYGTVEVIVTQRTPKAYQMNRDGDTQWIPATLLSYGSEEDIDALGLGVLINIEIKHWKLRELGWI